MVEVPSNLIPTRISQLPTAPVASADGTLLFNYQGVSYQVRAGDLLQVAGVPTTTASYSWHCFDGRWSTEF